MNVQQKSNFTFHNYHPKPANFYQEIIDGLSQHPKRIPPKFFYDELGSKLFAQICETADYYPTRTEYKILEQNRGEIADLVGSGCLLMEPGSGNSEKVRILLKDIRPKAYLPLDISKQYLADAAKSLVDEFPWLQVHAACIDYTRTLDLPTKLPQGRRVAFFPGSSIGNFEPDEAVQFLNNIAQAVGPGGGLLIGVDVKKAADVLKSAYNDTKGTTAAFNKNLLRRINREVGANFNLAKFRHEAYYNEQNSRVEMHLISCENQTITIKERNFHFKRDESIHTENSYKYHPQEFRHLARQAGFSPVRIWMDEEELFSVHYYQVK